MLQINAPVNVSSGQVIPTGVICAWTPDFANSTREPGTGAYSIPTSLGWYYDLASVASGKDSFSVVEDLLLMNRLFSFIINLTPAESLNPSKSNMEPYIQAYLETIYGVGNVVII
jgi:hypothetical protein